MTQRHKHADCIIAWANGAEIQAQQNATGKWVTIHRPQWEMETFYRVKPEPKPDEVFYGRLDQHGADLLTYVRGFNENIKATFDGETGILKSVEMIK